MKKSKSLILAAIIASSMSLSGCVVALLGAGYVAGEEISEDDGKIDPLDKFGEKEKDSDD